MPATANSSLEEKRQFRVLARHFFRQFFESELMPSGVDRRSSTGAILGLVSIPGMWSSFWLMDKYGFLSKHPEIPRAPVIWGDKSFFVSLAMLVLGLVAVIEWGSLYGERKDALVLGPLPVRNRTVLAARLAAVGLFLMLFTCAVNFFSQVMFSMTAAPAATLPAVRFAAGHVLSCYLAAFFGFLSVMAMQAVLLNVLGPRRFRRFSPFAQFLCIVWLLNMFFLFPPSLLKAPLDAEAVRLAYLFPPAWFVGLSEVLDGSREARFHLLARHAVDGLAVVVLLVAAGFVASYGRHLRRALEMETGGSHAPGLLDRLITRAVNGLIARRPVERAVFHFTALTLRRSRRNRMILAGYLGLGTAIAFQGAVVAFLSYRHAPLDRPSSGMLSVAFVLTFFLLAGMRASFSMPSDGRANWAFRVAEPASAPNCVAAVRKAMLWLGTVPLLAMLFPLHASLWGWRIAAMHSLLALALALLLIEGLLWNFRKIPFTCAWMPGAAGRPGAWIAWSFGFTLYAWTMASLEVGLLKQPRMFAYLTAFLFCAGAALAVWRRRRAGTGGALNFEELPDPVVRTLNLSLGKLRKA